MDERVEIWHDFLWFKRKKFYEIFLKDKVVFCVFSNTKNPETEQKQRWKVRIQLCYHIKSVGQS